MKRYAAVLMMIILLLTSIPAAHAQESAKIPVSPGMATDESTAFTNSGYTVMAQVLFDEQENIPELPGLKPSANPNSMNWQPTKKSDYLPIRSLVDLGAYYYVTDIAFFDTNGILDVTFRMGEPFQWTDVLTQPTNQYNSWRSFTIEPISTRYIQIEASFFDSGINEVALYGYPDENRTVEEPEYEGGERPLITAGEAIGANGFVDDPQDVLNVLGNVREYHNLSWTSQEGEKCTFHTPWWNFDNYYQQLAESGVTVIPCIQGTANWILGTGGSYASSNNIPVPEGADTFAPASYKAHASVMFQYAARYGHTQVEESRLSLAEDETPKTGLGYLTYYEDFNEQNKSWEGKASYMSPYEYAAMASATYDGHEGTIGENYGLVSADPNAKFAMGGLVGDCVIDYLEGMKFWFAHNRSDGRFVPDVLNVHYYVTDNCPEKSNFKARLAELTAWRDENLPDKEVWCSEFNVTATDKEIENVESMDNPEYLNARAERLTRAYLLGLSTGTDRLSMFMSRDTDGGVYGDDGLTTKKGEWIKKPVWYYTATLKNILSNTVFDRIVCENDDVYVYKFRDVMDETKEIYALWSPTIDGSQIKDYTLEVGGKKEGIVTVLQNGEAEGASYPVAVTDGTVTVDVSEKPVFVTVSGVDDVYRIDSFKAETREDRVDFTAAIVNGEEPYTCYAYIIREGELVYKKTDFIVPEFSFIPEEPGTYTALLYCDDAGGRRIKKALEFYV